MCNFLYSPFSLYICSLMFFFLCHACPAMQDVHWVVYGNVILWMSGWCFEVLCLFFYLLQKYFQQKKTNVRRENEKVVLTRSRQMFLSCLDVQRKLNTAVILSIGVSCVGINLFVHGTKSILKDLWPMKLLRSPWLMRFSSLPIPFWLLGMFWVPFFHQHLVCIFVSALSCISSLFWYLAFTHKWIIFFFPSEPSSSSNKTLLSSTISSKSSSVNLIASLHACTAICLHLQTAGFKLMSKHELQQCVGACFSSFSSFFTANPTAQCEAVLRKMNGSAFFDYRVRFIFLVSDLKGHAIK